MLLCLGPNLHLVDQVRRNQYPDPALLIHPRCFTLYRFGGILHLSLFLSYRSSSFLDYNRSLQSGPILGSQRWASTLLQVRICTRLGVRLFVAGFAGLWKGKEVSGLVSSVRGVGHLCPRFLGLVPSGERFELQWQVVTYALGVRSGGLFGVHRKRMLPPKVLPCNATNVAHVSLSLFACLFLKKHFTVQVVHEPH